MTRISSIAIRISNVEAMTRFYSEAFGIEFQEVNTYGIRSLFGEIDGVTLKFVPIRDSDNFDEYPIHQPGFTVADVEAVVALAIKHGGRQEGRLIRHEGKLQAAVRDPDGNTLELYSE